MHFKIHGKGKKNLNGDGLAIWYTKERVQKGKRYRTSYFIPSNILLSTLCPLIVLQVLYLEIWTTSPAWACLWTRIPTRRNTSRYDGVALLRTPVLWGSTGWREVFFV